MPLNTDNKSLSIVFSFLNEEENLDELIRRTRAAIESCGLEYEIIFVNDNSTDRSLEILRRYCSEDGRIKVLTTSRRFGPSPCALAGLARTKGDAVVYMDSDLQDPPELIPTLVEEWRKGADVVNTTRTKRHGENALKMWMTRLAYRIINSLSDTDIPMNTGDFKLMSRKVVKQLVQLREYDPFLRGLVRWVGFEQVQIFYERDPRYAGETHVSIFGPGPARAFISGIASFSAAPLYFGMLLGGFVSLLSFLYLTFILVTTIGFHMNLPGWPAQMVTMLFLGGVTLFTIGIQGIYIGRMYQELKGRPNYIIAAELNFDSKAEALAQQASTAVEISSVTLP